MPDDGLIDVLTKIADGTDVDWASAESSASSDDERELLRELRVLAQLSQVHRSSLTAERQDEVEDTIERALRAFEQAPPPAGLATWGRYELLEKLGEGSFGAVHRARDADLERPIAIKLLHAALAERDPLSERIRREGVALARIRHSNVVTVYGVETHGGRLGLCMEYVPGETLEERLRSRGRLSAEDAAIVGQFLCRALSAVHAAGLVHRDVKARNVMIEASGRVVLMDFGAGREMAHLAAAGARDVAGTPLYMAPEVLDGGAATPQSDIYALGVLLYYLVTQRYPVEGASLDAIRAAHRAGARRFLIERRQGLPDRFVRAVERALAPTPDARFPSVAGFCEELASVADASLVTMPGDGLVVRPSMLSRDYWLRLSARGKAAACALAFAAVLGALTMFGYLASVLYHMVLGVPAEFVDEGPWEWFALGSRATIIPVLLFSAVSWGVAIGARTIWAVAERASPWFRRHTASMKSFDDPHAIATAVAVGGMAALAGVLWVFSDLWRAFSNPISEYPPETFAALAPAMAGWRTVYRLTLYALTILMLVGLGRTFRSRRAHAVVGSWTPVAASVLVVVFAVLLLQMPHRLFVETENFATVHYRGTSCFVLAENASSQRVYCPQAPSPRVLTVALTDPDRVPGSARGTLFAR